LASHSNPTPAYLFRRYLARQLLETVPPGRFLEIGVGSGRFYEELELRGFSGLCLDLNDDLIQEHQQQRNHAESTIVFQSRDFFTLQEQFDLIIAFEVLEHYEADQLCLRKWESLLRHGGTLIFSVPAHMRQWTRNDTRAGHARRYEKVELMRKLSASHLHLENLWCYGFPILNVTYPLSSILLKSDQDAREATSQENQLPSTPTGSRPSLRSPVVGEYGNARDNATNLTRTSQSGRPRFPQVSSWLFQRWLWMPFLQLQKFFLRGDLGTGYIVKCRKE
jgi:SAM-dependent methyltransferase